MSLSLATFVAALLLVAAQQYQVEPVSEKAPTIDLDPVAQSSEDALAQDLRLTAEAMGWSLQEAEKYLASARAVGKIAEQVAAARPESFVGSAVSSDPMAPPTLYVRGPADEFITNLASVAGTIIVSDNQPFSFSELEERKFRVHRSLLDHGFLDVVTTYDIRARGLIDVAVFVRDDPTKAEDAIIDSLPVDLRDDVRLRVLGQPVVVGQGAFGGMRLKAGPSASCTSGWTVTHINSGQRGVTGAGHCNGINGIDHPGHGLHAAAFQAQHLGQWGDVEWYTTGELETDDFYADATTIRDVEAVEPRANISLNEIVCVYGRSTNVRDFSARVSNASTACGNLDRIVQMNKDVTTTGDSGGGWSYNNTAFGIHFGLCDNLSSFSVADLLDEALGVFVRTT